jgi:hypothetical protein
MSWKLGKGAPATYNLETAQAALAACTHDLAEEDDRMKTLDSKLTQLAAFSGVSISISGSVGGSVLAAGHLHYGFLIALGACISIAACLLLAAVVIAFRGLAPKDYRGIDEAAPRQRTTVEAMQREPAVVVAEIAAARRDIFLAARVVNDRKARATSRTFTCVGMGFGALVLGVLVTTVGSVV